MPVSPLLFLGVGRASVRGDELSKVIFLSFVWAGTRVHFQLSVLHLLKHTRAHTHGQVGGLIAGDSGEDEKLQ